MKVFGLSKKEVVVIKLVAEGLSDLEVADKLGIEHSTVRSHVNSIYKRMGVNSRIKAVNAARDAGILH